MEGNIEISESHIRLCWHWFTDVPVWHSSWPPPIICLFLQHAVVAFYGGPGRSSWGCEWRRGLPSCLAPWVCELCPPLYSWPRRNCSPHSPVSAHTDRCFMSQWSSSDKKKTGQVQNKAYSVVLQLRTNCVQNKTGSREESNGFFTLAHLWEKLLHIAVEFLSQTESFCKLCLWTKHHNAYM